MAELGEGVIAGLIKALSSKYIFVAIERIMFESGIDIYHVQAGGAEKKLPPGGAPHWGGAKVYPAVYVRQGGSGETNDLKVKVKWRQNGYDGAAKLKGTSVDGEIVIEGSFTISGEKGSADASCQFKKKPDKVENYGIGIGIKWHVEAGGATTTATGATLLKLFFVDSKPLPVSWGYKKHYLRVINWTTSWAKGKSGATDVFKALWNKFSNGSAARVPHATGFSYWKTDNPVQDLKTLITPGGPVLQKGWSCRAIAHLFMECMALHGLKCLEVIPNTAPGTRLFLVQNWDVKASPIPNWGQYPDRYYAGSWIGSDKPPLNLAVSTSLKKQVVASGPVMAGQPPPIVTTKDPIAIDMRKKPGVPAQGQSTAPLGFSNHWIVEANGFLYDTSYGAKHANDMGTYRNSSLAGWLVRVIPDEYSGGFLWLTTKRSSAWQCRARSSYSLIRMNGDHN